MNTSAGTSRIKLSAPFVNRLAPTATPQRYWDSEVPGLFLRLQPSGVKSWNVAISRTSSHALGKWPMLTIGAARRQALGILGQLADGKMPEPVARRRARRQARTEGRPETLRHLVKLYREHAEVKTRTGAEAAGRIERVFDKLLDLPLEKLTHARVEDVLVKRQANGAAEATIAKDIALIKRCLAWAIEREDLREHPLRKLKAPKFDNHRIRYLSPEERVRLFEGLAKRDGQKKEARARTIAGNRQQHADVKAIPAGAYADALEPAVRVSLSTGLRRGELFTLDWSDINLDAPRLTVRSAYAKSGKTRHIPLNSEAVEVLDRWRKQTGGTGRVFMHASARKAWEALLDEAKLTDFHWHDLRHDFASRLVMAGVDLNTVRELLGHASLAMTLRYAHLAPDHLKAAVAALDTKLDAGGGKRKVVQFPKRIGR